MADGDSLAIIESRVRILEIQREGTYRTFREKASRFSGLRYLARFFNPEKYLEVEELDRHHRNMVKEIVDLRIRIESYEEK